MTSIKAARRALASLVAEDVEGAPDAELVVAPSTLDEAAAVLDLASEHRLPVLVWGGGTHQGYGARVEADLVLATERLDAVSDWEPDDLTLVAEAGARVDEVEAMLAEGGQTAVLPERAGAATVGGVVAAGVSGWRRYRYGPTRDRMLEVTLVTGDGRVVRGGGRVVKNVTGYDLPRLAAGSFGALGLIGRVCLKLWPLPAAAGTVTVADAEMALATAYRPLAVIATREAAKVYLAGTPEEVQAQAAELGGELEEGLHWPEDLAGEVQLSLRVPPATVSEAVAQLPNDWSYQAAYGVGEVRVGADAPDAEEAAGLRRWAEERGGALVVTQAPPSFYASFDPWGTAPDGLELQRRMVARFDPLRVVNPGRLPGGL